MTTEEFSKKLEKIPNGKLIEMAHTALSNLCSTGGRSFTMTVPPRTDDTDMILSEVITRFKNNNALGGIVKPNNNMVRAKFRVDEVAQTVNGGKVLLSPVTSGSKENEEFFKWTPYGRIEMGTINPEAIKQFVPGKECYVDFTPVE